ncbi:DNase I-like protein [Rickenella mellea]|uniref:DNase I-like protein n=1 Tax=Rickenella mellea TaxID=50990 RepID=A0A4Y7PSU5_9AGAM|nr:DNase I-like protein [Rickenella mellea]
MPPPSPAPDRKVLGSSHLPPPPTRTIALGDKLPPARRPPSGSSSDEDEEDPAHKGGRPIDLLPDASRSSRRPPIIAASPLSQFKAPVPSQTSVVAVAGHCVAVGHHNVKIYDASLSDLPRFTVELKEVATDWRVKDPKVMSMEFRHNSIDTERGCFLWVGTKEGHLWEIDVRIGVIVSTKPAAHAHAVTHIFRHGRTMITLDDSGKALVFAPDHEGPGGDVRLSGTQPRVARIADKQGFARMLGGLLWTSGGPGSGSGNGGHPNGPGPARGPLVRAYDILSSACTAKTLLPLETVGAVTSGTILPSQPSTVYLGHEGGFISLWTIATSTSVPTCTEVIKVSASDVLCLEGVNDRLWAGSRKGMIAAYDVVQRPWVVTNCWNAHNGLPVQRLGVDPWSMEKCGKLSVVSVGRDELAKFWDGLLGVDWIDHELLKRETSFSTFRPLNVLIVSWNIDSARPETLIGTPDNINFLENTLRSVDSPDIISFGFQEVIDLENRKMAAKTVLLGGKGKNKNGVEVGGSGGANVLSEKVTRAYKMWYDRLVYAVRLAMPPDCPYTVVHAESLVGLLTCIFVKVSERAFLSDAAVASIKRGMGGRYGNKGGIISRFVIQDSSFCFINCHLAAGQHHVRTRNADVAAILDESSIFPGSEASMDASAYTGGGDGSMVLDHEFVFLNGDMNYRIDARRDAVVAAVHAGDYAQLFPHDQLLKEMRVNRGFRLRSFTEGPITFAPTYKYDRRTSEYDSSEKKRIPAWCDRVLYRSREPARVNLLHYQRYEANVSDHRPISAAFRVTIKAVDQEKRARIKEDVDELWLVHQHELLFAAREFYVTQEII